MHSFYYYKFADAVYIWLQPINFDGFQKNPTNLLAVTVYDMHDGHCFAPTSNVHTFLSDSYVIPRVPLSLTGANTGFRKGGGGWSR